MVVGGEDFLSFFGWGIGMVRAGDFSELVGVFESAARLTLCMTPAQRLRPATRPGSTCAAHAASGTSSLNAAQRPRARK